MRSATGRINSMAPSRRSLSRSAHLRRSRMGQEKSLSHRGLRAPRAAAIAGILFCGLLITSRHLCGFLFLQIWEDRYWM